MEVGVKTRIEKGTLDFLKQLAKNNNRDWFNSHKDSYLRAMENFSAFISGLISGASKFDKSVSQLTPKDCVFRIYRDTRFAKDKSPYKIHFGAHIIGGDEKCGYAGYYIHLQPGSTFLAGGVHMPEPDRLKGIRDEISRNGSSLKKILSTADFKKTFKEITGEKLKTVPKGFEKDDPMLPYLQFKDLIIHHDVSDATVLSSGFEGYCLKTFKSMVPFNNFLNKPVR